MWVVEGFRQQLHTPIISHWTDFHRISNQVVSLLLRLFPWFLLQFGVETWLQITLCETCMGGPSPFSAPLMQSYRRSVLKHTWAFVFILFWWDQQSRKRLPLKDGFVLAVPQRRGCTTPCRATRGSSWVGWEAVG